MPIPRTREELSEAIERELGRLVDALASLPEGEGGPVCTEEGWTVAQLLAVRAWWTVAVCDWVEAGRRGEVPVTPAPGHSWHETPRLNQATAERARGATVGEGGAVLTAAARRALALVEALDDRELLEVGAFEWCGKWPVRRWLSVNTATQYDSARKLVRRAIRSG